MTFHFSKDQETGGQLEDSASRPVFPAESIDDQVDPAEMGDRPSSGRHSGRSPSVRHMPREPDGLDDPC